jgi:hypothetical protein
MSEFGGKADLEVEDRACLPITLRGRPITDNSCLFKALKRKWLILTATPEMTQGELPLI